MRNNKDCKVAENKLKMNLAKTDLTVQPLMDNAGMDRSPMENLSEGNRNKKKRLKRNKKKKAAINDEVQSIDQTTMDARSMEDLLGAHLTAQLVPDNLKMDVGSIENLSAVNANKEKKESPERNKEKKVTVKDEIQSMDQSTMDKRITENGHETDLTIQPLADKVKMDAGSKENLSEGSTNMGKKKRQKRNKKKKAEIKDEVQSMDKTPMATRSAKILLDTDLAMLPQADNPKMDAGSTENLSEGNVNKKKKKRQKRNKNKAIIMDEVQSMDKCTMDTMPKENILETDLTEQPAADNLKADAGSIENLSVGNVNKEKKKRLKRKKKKAAVMDEVRSMDQTTMETSSNGYLLETDLSVRPLADNPKTETGSTENLADGDKIQTMDQNTLNTGSTENLAEGSVTRKRKRKQKRSKAPIIDAIQNMDQTKTDVGSTEKATITYEVRSTDQTTTETRSNGYLLEIDLSVQPPADNPKTEAGSIENLADGDKIQTMDQTTVNTGSTENLTVGNVTCKRKRKKKRNKAPLIDAIQSVDQTKTDARSTEKATIADEVQSMDQTTMGTSSNGYLLDTDLSVQPLADNPKTETGSIENLADGDKIQTMDQTTANTWSTENLAEGNVTQKRKREESKAPIIGAIQNVDQTKMDARSTENLAEGSVASKRKRKRKSKKCTDDTNNPSVSLSNLRDKPLDLCKHEETVLLSNVVEGSCYKAASGLAQERCGPLAQPMELEGKLIPCESQQMAHISTANEVDNEIILYQGKVSAEGSSFSACNVDVPKHFPSCAEKHADCLYPKIAQSIPSRRKLLVLDVNGLLADVVQPPPKNCTARICMFGRAIFRRPFCNDFMKFCFQNFDVGIWSSRSRKILNKVVNYILGRLKRKLLFCWDRARCTQTGFNTLENKHKPLVCKELKKIWDNNDPNLPWKKGDYNESNTLLLDDSPYKALLNPLNTAIFPHSYSYMDKNDNSLGPGGDLRVYLEGLLASENVQKYVEQHPFGQGNIDEKSFSWGFYAGVLNHMEEMKTHHSTGTSEQRHLHNQ